MKSDFFSDEILESYLSNLKKTQNPEDRLKKSIYIIEWLDWLYSKSFISSTDYERSIASVKKHTSFYSKKEADVFHIVQKRAIKIALLCTLLGGLLFTVYIYIFNSDARRGFIEAKNEQFASRTLPYRGRLLDDRGLPISSKKDITFRIYTAPAVGEAIYTGVCRGEDAIEPDYKGNFSVVLGSDCGMSYIPETIFQTNKEIYLGVQIGSATELTPRQKISTSGYATDTAKLQGLPLGTGKESIPFINKQGRVIFNHADPFLQSITGTLTIESPSVTIKTNDDNNGSILFQPSSQGNTIVGNGKFAVGTYTPVSAITVNTIEPFGGVGTFKNLALEDDESLSVLQLHIGSPITGTASTFMKFYAESTTENEGIQVGAIRLNNEGVAYETSGADFAEYFNTNEPDIDPGYIMSLSSTGVHKARTGEIVVGVTSDNAGFVGNKKNTKVSNSLIALTGQVKVYVINVGENIVEGDEIVVSDIDGIGTKGNNKIDVAGYALESAGTDNRVECPLEISHLKSTNIFCNKILILLK